MIAVLNLVVLRVADLELAAEFYEALGLIFNRHSHGTGPEHLACNQGSFVFELYPATEKQPVSTSTRIGFSVSLLDEVVDRLTTIPGAMLVSPALDSEWGRRAVMADPDGHRVELIETRR